MPTTLLPFDDEDCYYDGGNYYDDYDDYGNHDDQDYDDHNDHDYDDDYLDNDDRQVVQYCTTALTYDGDDDDVGDDDDDN